MGDREKDVASKVYELAGLERSGGEDAASVARREELVAELRGCEILVEDEERGTGWRLLDADGVNLNPGEDLLFADKGQCWVYWCGYGRPPRARMCATSDPLVEAAAAMSAGPIVLDGGRADAGDRAAAEPRFEVIEGGAVAAAEERLDGPETPSVEWELEEKIGADLERELADEAADRVSAAADEVVARWGDRALEVLCDAIENATGLELVAYDDEADRVIHGDELIERLGWRTHR